MRNCDCCKRAPSENREWCPSCMAQPHNQEDILAVVLGRELIKELAAIAAQGNLPLDKFIREMIEVSIEEEEDVSKVTKDLFGPPATARPAAVSAKKAVKTRPMKPPKK